MPAAGPLPAPSPSSNHPFQPSLPRIPATMEMTPQEQVDQARRRFDAFTANMIASHQTPMAICSSTRLLLNVRGPMTLDCVDPRRLGRCVQADID